MSTKRCYYETLEVAKGADGTLLKSAYRKLAMKFHPDKNPGDHTAEIKFKEINEAYDVLKDDQKRAAYDRFVKWRRATARSMATWPAALAMCSRIFSAR